MIQAALRKIKKSSAALLAVCAVASIALTTETLAEVNGEQSLRAGSWSLLFAVEDNLQLGAFEGLVLSGKRHLSESSAVRFGITLALSSKSEDMNTELSGRTLSPMNESSDGVNVGVSALYMLYPTQVGRMNPFLALGPSIGYEGSSSSQIDLYYGLNQDGEVYRYLIDRMESSTHKVYAGLKGAVGVEWFATSRISFVAEYDLHLRYTHTDGDQVATSSEYALQEDGSFGQEEPREPSVREETTDKHFEVAPTSVQFGLTVYF